VVERRRQLALARETVRRSRPRPVSPPAAVDPIARVAVDVPHSHLDRPFDYLVPEPLAATAVAGARVRVRFSGQLVDGIVLERAAVSEHTGVLARLVKVVSAEPVLTPDLARLARAVADRWAGTLADVLRLAIPPRHAGAEAEPAAPPAPDPPAPAPGAWTAYDGGPAYLAALTAGAAARAVTTALPGSNWPAMLATAVAATLAGGRGALVVVPDGRDLARVDAALGAALSGAHGTADGRQGPRHHLTLSADLGPGERYRRWLAVRRGTVRAVAGTRAAMFAPVADLGLVVIWDDGDDLHAEPRAPYPHVREVLCLRAHQLGAGALLAGTAMTAEGAALLATGWARPLAAPRAAIRAAAPRVVVAGDDAELERDPAAASARLPSLAWRTAREALLHGPVLVQVPRRGYLPGLSCQQCRHPARCLHCGGPLTVAAARGPATCSWCGRTPQDWRCSACAATTWRAQVVGARRTAEELGRAFPSVPIRTSGRAGPGDGPVPAHGPTGVLATVPATPALVVATPGAEPVAPGGYAAALLLDGWALLARPDLRAAEEALRRWLGAAALVRSATRGGVVVVLADPALVPVQALVRWDPAGHAARELAERAQLALPPATRVASITGSPTGVREILDVLDGVPTAAVLGPVPDRVPDSRPDPRPHPTNGTSSQADEPSVRAVVRVDRAHGPALARALQAAQGLRDARKATDGVRIRVDPPDLG
jgi:primosomal protein N' (replication factor Y)